MNAGLSQIHDALGKMREAIDARAEITPDLSSAGEHVLSIGKAALLRQVDIVIEQIATSPDVPLPKEVLADVPLLKTEILAVTTKLIPQVGGPHSGYAVPQLIAFLLSVSARLKPAIAWSEVVSQGKMPLALTRRISELSAELDGLVEDARLLANQKTDAQTILAGIEGAVTAAKKFAGQLEDLEAHSKASAEATKASAEAAAKSSEQAAAVLKRAEEIGAAVAATSEKTEANSAKVGEAATTAATLAGQVKAQADSVASAEQRVTSAAEAGAKAGAKIATEAEQSAKSLAVVTQSEADAKAKKAEVDAVADSVKKTTAETVAARGTADKHAKDAEASAKKAQDAYRIVTTTGLAGAFNQRARNLMWFSLLWLAVLGVALILASIIGSERTKEISALMQKGSPDGIILLIQLVLSVLTVGAPVWMAWLATKQIAHSFRLSEDYGYKAAMAKAYEGFKVEAVNIDKQFEARLFAAALERLGENPIRLLSPTEPGSPIQELMGRPEIQKLLEKFPDAGALLLDAVKGVFVKTPVKKAAAAAAEKPATPPAG